MTHYTQGLEPLLVAVLIVIGVMAYAAALRLGEMP